MDPEVEAGEGLGGERPGSESEGGQGSSRFLRPLHLRRPQQKHQKRTLAQGLRK